MSGDTQKAIMVRVSPEVWRDLKQLATQLELEKGERVTLQSLLNEAIEHILKPTNNALDEQGAKHRVIYHPDIRKACQLNYGKVPASAVAFLHGVSSNVVWSHWNRLEKKADIARTAKTVLEEVSAKHGMRSDQIIEASRKRRVVRARNEAIYRLREEFDLSYPSIAAVIRRDHSTVMHGYGRHKAELASGVPA